MVAENENISVANAIRAQKITAMRGLAVRVRNTHVDSDGRRRCDIYVRVEE